ncbi:major histocompatibility complex class I-related gene protein-like [Misgurnus anguillicaudatus]|uniref:major histocompatibility complex class I-related gene protein-like n=1 Tax=Misgurnus anguillicaudatus TaxID=75329 RepID=UPI003CCF2A80
MFHFFTAVTGDPNILKATGVAKIDDQQVTYFDSITMKSVPKTEWFKLNEDYWNRQTENGIFVYNQYKNYMPNIMNFFNHSISGMLTQPTNIQPITTNTVVKTFRLQYHYIDPCFIAYDHKKSAHTLQLLYGCELEDDGTVRGYLQIGYDGEDFISLDTKKLSWIPANPPAANFKKILDANKVQTSMEKECIEYLKKYVSYANDNMERKVSPKVSLLQKNSSSPVICHATGFYSQNITMTWMKNHEELYEDVEVSSTLPNEDGSFQKSISLLVKSEEWKKNPDVYRCVVQSVGKGKEIVVLLNENNIKSNSGMCEWTKEWLHQLYLKKII